MSQIPCGHCGLFVVYNYRHNRTDRHLYLLDTVPLFGKHHLLLTAVDVVVTRRCTMMNAVLAASVRACWRVDDAGCLVVIVVTTTHLPRSPLAKSAAPRSHWISKEQAMLPPEGKTILYAIGEASLLL
jgi:hypothetical protein